MELDIETAEDGKVAIVTIQSENLDAGNVKKFQENIQPAIDTSQCVVVDMRRLEFVDSSGLGSLLSTLRKVNTKQGQLKLFGMSKPVQALFELVRMHRIFAIYESREEALATL